MIERLSPDRTEACLDVVRTLPEWFGYEGALEGIASALANQEGFVAIEGDEVLGFVTLSPVFTESLEITYLGVRRKTRRHGYGRLLVFAARDYARTIGASSICLLTLGPSAHNDHYTETVEFYRSIGFWRTKELYLTAWGGAPTLLMSAPLERLG